MSHNSLTVVFVGAMLALLLAPQRADAALNAHLNITGETQGKVEGGSTQAGREGSIEIYGFSHEVVSPRDAASGLPTGKRQHKPIVVTKPIDKSTPILFTMLTNNENITEFRLDFYAQDRSGREVNHYTIELVNASIAGIRTEMLNNKYPENATHEVREHVSFTYQKIIWTWQDGGITAEDDWETPVALGRPKKDDDRVAAAKVPPPSRNFWALRAAAIRPEESEESAS